MSFGFSAWSGGICNALWDQCEYFLILHKFCLILSNEYGFDLHYILIKDLVKMRKQLDSNSVVYANEV